MHRFRMVYLHMIFISSKLDIFMLRVLLASPYPLLMRPLLMARPLFPAVVDHVWFGTLSVCAHVWAKVVFEV